MIKIMDKEYITDKQAESLYGFSRDWFKKKRCLGGGPPYTKISGKILYQIHELDKWFKDNMKSSENDL